MRKISYARHRFPPAIIQQAIWVYFRFPLSFRDIEEMLTERGIEVSCETIRRWILKFGTAISANVRFHGVRPSGTWRLDEVFVRVAALLHKSGDWQVSPFTGQTYPTASVTGMLSAVQSFMTAMRT